MTRDTRAAFLALLDKQSPLLRRAFEEAVADVRSVAQMRVLEDAIARGDIEAAIRALQLGPEFYAPLDRAISEAFYQGGVYQISRLPKRLSSGSGGPLIIRFDQRNPRAERWVRQKSSGLIVEIVEGQKHAVRQTIMAGLQQGQGPRSVARDIVGRVEGNQRVGGILGLHSTHAEWVRSARDELSDPERMANYFTRKRRDKRFDRTVSAAIREGRKLSEGDIRRITGRYADRLLGLRGETIARTEALPALNASRVEGLEQLIETGRVTREQIGLGWDATGDARTRPDHAAMHGQTVRFGEPFTAPDGSRMMYPGDPSLGAPAHQVAQCRCYLVIKIDFLAAAI